MSVMSYSRKPRVIDTAVHAAQIIAFVANFIVAVNTIVAFVVLVWGWIKPKRIMGFTKVAPKRRRRKDEHGQRQRGPVEEGKPSPTEGEQEEGQEEAREQEHGDAVPPGKRHERQGGREAPGEAG